MKKILLFLLLLSAFTAKSQNLKDLLYSGKLKNDSGSVVKKTDDLSTKIDTSKKKPVEADLKKMEALSKDSMQKGKIMTTDSAAANATDVAIEKVVPKDNNAAWKEYIDSFKSTLAAEVLPDKKIKPGTYYVLLDYSIEADGQVTINSVSPSPENSYLQQQIRERLTLTAPKLAPVEGTNGKPRKVNKKYTLIVAKK
ncbi:MAG: hypothetical protein JSU05_07005 [Bacteroidetes bacterium]|nr:hypothetical protein [Bacteroidota bacterium]